MSEKLHTRPVPTAPTPGRATATHPGVVAGLAAGPVMTAVWVVQGLVRDGYDFTRHPMSLLAVGEGGWVQILNFLVTGALVLVGGRAIRSGVAGGIGQDWAPRLITIMALGLIGSGLFTADPGAGFPAGAPEGAPDYSWHGILHEISHLALVVAWVAFALVMRRRFNSEGRRTAARLVIPVVVAAFLLVGLPHLASFPIRLVLVGALQLVYVGLVIRTLHRHPAQPIRTAD